MNYPNTVQRSYNKQVVKKPATKINLIRLSMLAIPVVLLTIILVFILSSLGTDSVNARIKVQTANAGGGQRENQLFPAIILTDKETSVARTEELVETTLLYTDREVKLIAKTVYGEALVTQSDMEMAAVAWCILNRVDSAYYPNTIEEVITQKRQFHGYDEQHPVTQRIEKVVRDVLDRWCAEKNGVADSGRILPKEYLYFEGDGKHNHYSTEFLGKEFWDWSLPNPYEN